MATMKNREDLKDVPYFQGLYKIYEALMDSVDAGLFTVENAVTIITDASFKNTQMHLISGLRSKSSIKKGQYTKEHVVPIRKAAKYVFKQRVNFNSFCEVFELCRIVHKTTSGENMAARKVYNEVYDGCDVFEATRVQEEVYELAGIELVKENR
jgi:hypothetical protein